MLKLTTAEFNQLIDAGEIEESPKRMASEMSVEAQEILAQASPQALQTANDRYRLIVEPMLQGQPPLDTTRHRRTCYRYLSNFRKPNRFITVATSG